MSWLDDPLDKRILHELTEFRRETSKNFKILSANQSILFDQSQKILDLLQPRLASLVIVFEGGIMDATIQVGQTKTANVLGFDQFNQPFTIDFTANPPSWSIADPAIATIAPNATTPTSEDVTGVAAGTDTLNVSCAGLTASATVTVTAPTPVLTSLQINFT